MIASRGERRRVKKTSGPGTTESPAGSHRQSLVEKFRHSCTVTKAIAAFAGAGARSTFGVGVRSIGAGASGAGRAGSAAGAGVGAAAGTTVGDWRGVHGRAMKSAAVARATTAIASVAGAGDTLRETGGDGGAAAGAGAASGRSIGSPRARQKSSRFCRLATTIGSSAGSDADAIATARR